MKIHSSPRFLIQSFISLSICLSFLGGCQNESPKSVDKPGSDKSESMQNSFHKIPIDGKWKADLKGFELDEYYETENSSFEINKSTVQYSTTLYLKETSANPKLEVATLHLQFVLMYAFRECGCPWAVIKPVTNQNLKDQYYPLQAGYDDDEFAKAIIGNLSRQVEGLYHIAENTEPKGFRLSSVVLSQKEIELSSNASAHPF